MISECSKWRFQWGMPLNLQVRHATKFPQVARVFCTGLDTPGFACNKFDHIYINLGTHYKRFTYKRVLLFYHTAVWFRHTCAIPSRLSHYTFFTIMVPNTYLHTINLILRKVSNVISRAWRRERLMKRLMNPFLERLIIFTNSWGIELYCWLQLLK